MYIVSLSRTSNASVFLDYCTLKNLMNYYIKKQTIQNKKMHEECLLAFLVNEHN